MAVSKESVICPYCKKEHSKHKAICKSGLINFCGSEITIEEKNEEIIYEKQ